MENTIDDVPILSPKGTFPATVAKIIDNYKLVINRGSEHGIQEGQRMLVYNIDNEDIKDPDTGESLGYLELVKGTGTIIFTQDKISILESDKMGEFDSNIIPQNITNNIEIHGNKIDNLYIGGSLNKEHLIAFDNPQIGDQVKPI